MVVTERRARFWILLILAVVFSVLATCSLLLDHYVGKDAAAFIASLYDDAGAEE